MEKDYAYWQPNIGGKLGGALKVIKLHHAPLVEGPALLGAFIYSVPSARILLLVLAAAFSVHVFGETYNELVGIKWHLNDPIKRPFVAGTLTVPEGYMLVLAGVAGLEISAYLLNRWALFLSPLVVLAALIYPHLKDKTAASTYVLSAIVSMGILGGYVAVFGGMPFEADFLLHAPWLFALSGLFFTAYFDEVANLPNLELHKKVGLAEFSAVKSSNFTLRFITLNGIAYLGFALAGCFAYSVGPVAVFLALASAVVWAVARSLVKAGNYGKAVDRSLIAWLILVCGVIISRLI
ncbi:MAG: UbiA family prenyltransferase [Thermoprotei archaeon]